MKKLLALVSLLIAPMAMAAPMEHNFDTMVWNETAESGKHLDTEIIERMVFTKQAEQKVGQSTLHYVGKYYFGGGPYIGTDFNDTSKHAYGVSAYFGTSQEEQAHVRLNATFKAVGGVGVETWLRYQSGAEFFAVPYARFGTEYKGDKSWHGAFGFKKPLTNAFESGYNNALDGSYTLHPKGSYFSPYARVGFDLKAKRSVEAYYDGFNFGASADDSNGVYQPHSTMSVIGVQFHQKF